MMSHGQHQSYHVHAEHSPEQRQNQQPWSQVREQPPLQSQPTQAPPDLMDEPLELSIPDRSSIAPPPIPPNPEKDALLGQLAHTLAALRQHIRQQNESSLAGLQAQRNAMLAVLPTMENEMNQLTHLSSVLSSNASILRESLRKADGVIEGSKSHSTPSIDELLVAPTVVANQLYALVAEERALGDAIFMLGRAVERGRISPAVFAKMTRSLAREWYLKKALVRKIGLGMGLAP
jgi:ESCRT-I complex subunit TSG101